MPAISDELLPGNAAALSQDTWLYSGSLVGLPAPKPLRQMLLADSAKVYRIPASYGRSTYLYDSLWLEFANADTDVVRAPVFDDVYDRYYMASTSSLPRYNTRARLEAYEAGELDAKAWLLGVPPPTVAPTLTVVGGSIKADNVRAATTAAQILATDFFEDKKIDGVTLAAGDRIFIKDQATASENGIYVIRANTTATPPVGVAPVRAEDMNNGGEFVGKFFKVLEGTVNGGSSWKITNTTPPTLGSTAITSEEVPELPLQVTRSYVYTWVTEYKEESAPSLPVVETGIQDASWNLSNLEVPSILDRGFVASPDARRWITKTRIYRTITSSSGTATFFLVAEQDCTINFYNDTIDDDEVSSNAQLESFAWTPPPPDLQGLVVMWNGIIAGWRENELWMCEPYRPHAWPAKFVNTLEYPIVGMGVAGQTLVVCTVGNPVTVNGSLPEHMTTAKVPNFEPCTSRGSILSHASGVYFVSPNGLILCGQGGAVNVTKDLLTRDKWAQYAGEAKLRAAWLGSAYYAFGSVVPGVFELTAWAGSHNDVVAETKSGSFDSGFNPDFELTSGFIPMPDWISKFNDAGAHNGFLIDPVNTRIAFNLLTSESPVMGVQNDPWSGEVFIIRDGEVSWIDVSTSTQPVEPGLWKSRVYQFGEARNLAAMRVYFQKTFGLLDFNPIRATPPVGADQSLTDDKWGVCRVYADGKLILARELRKSGELWKLPSGFTADFWQYEVESRVRVLNIQVASSAKELVTQ